MDLSKEQWSEWISIDRITTTPKLYFGKYFFRADFEVPLAHFVRLARFDRPYYIKSLRNDIQRERERQLRLMYHTLSPKKANDFVENMADLVEILRGAIAAKDTRTRIEGSRIRVFSVTADPIKEILRSSAFDPALFKGLEQPANLASVASLSEGVIYTKTAPKHKFRVTIRSKRYTPELKKQIRSYIGNYPGQFHLNYRLRASLNRDGSNWLEGYYYVNDTSLLTFLAMVCPSFVLKINRLELEAK